MQRDRLALLLAVVLLASVASVIVLSTLSPARSGLPSDLLGKVSVTADGQLSIRGGVTAAEWQSLQRYLSGSEVQPSWNLSQFVPDRSAYPTTHLVERSYLVPNLNVYFHPTRPPETLAGGVALLLGRLFPPVDWGAQVREAVTGVFGLLSLDARAGVVVHSTTVTDVFTGAGAPTCTTTQTAGPSDNAVLVLLSEDNTIAFVTVTYGAVSLSLIAGTNANGGAAVRNEIWGFAGALPSGSQTMTATITGGTNEKMTCATVLLQGVNGTGSFINGKSATAASGNAAITLTAAVGAGNLAFAVASLQQVNGAGGAQPTAVNGTGAAATDLYGVAAPGHCSGTGNTNACFAGADIPNPGTAITWTNTSTLWVVSAVEVVAALCGGGNGGANCYRIGAGGAWNSTTNWSYTSGGPACNCVPNTGDFALFNAFPTGTVSLAAGTAIAGLDMTGFTGTLDTTASNFFLTVNGNLTIQGVLLPEGSAITVTGGVTVTGATSYVTMSSSTWTVNGSWTNGSTSSAWSAGTSLVTIKDATSATLTFAALAGPTNEFNNLILDSSLAAGVTYTMATNALRVAGALTIQNSTAGATGNTVLSTSASNLGVVAGSVTLGTNGTLTANASTVTVNGNWTATATNATFTSGTSTISFGATGTVNMTQSFYSLAVAAGTLTLASNLVASNAVTVSAGILAKSTFTLNAASLTLSGGALTSTSGSVTVTGNVNVSAAASYIVFGSDAWTVSGSWTDASTSASWNAGTGSITFNAAAAQTMTFAGTGLAVSEFNNVTFNSGANTVIFTMSTRALRWAGTLTLQGGTGTTTLATASLGLTGGALVVGNLGVLTATASTVAVTTVTMTGGTSGTITLTTGSWTVSGNWDTSGAGSTFTKGTSTVTMSGAATTVKTLNSTNGFYGLTVSGTVTASSAIDVSGTLQTSGSGTLTTGGLAITGGAALTLAGTGGLVASTSALTLGSVSVGAGTTISLTTGTATVAGNWNSSPGTFTPGTGTVTLTAVTATVAVNGTAGFYNLTIASGSAITAASPIQVSHILTINGTGSFTTANGVNNYDLNVGTAGTGTSGNVTVAAGGSLIFAANGSMTASGNWDSTAGSFTPATSTVTMTGSGKTLKIAAGQSFNALSLGGGSVALASFLDTNGLTVTAGTFDLAGFSAFVNGSLSISGTGSVNFDSGSMTVTGNIVDSSITANTGSGTLVLPSAAIQSVQGGVWPNVQVVGGEKDFTGSLTTLNVTLLGTAGLILRVTAGITWTLLPGGVVSGVSSTARLTLTSTATWTMNVSGVTGIAQWVAVDHSTAMSPGMQAFNSVDGGFNTSWTFPTGGAPLGPFLVLLQHDPVIQISISALGLVGFLVVRRVHRKNVTCPVCGNRFTEECHEHP